MSRFKRKLSDLTAYAMIDNRDFLDNFHPSGSNKPVAQNKGCGNYKHQNYLYGSFEATKHTQNVPSVLNRLKRLETLIQTHDFSKARELKQHFIDPQLLIREYLDLVNRHKKIKGKCLMTPCLIPRSGIQTTSKHPQN